MKTSNDYFEQIMKILLKIICTLGLLCSSREAFSQTEEDSTGFKTFWYDEFAGAIVKNDAGKLRYHSLSYIQCRECLSNTEAERAEAASIQKLNIVTRGNLTLDQTEHIPFDLFIKNDYRLIFDSIVVARLRDSTMLEYRISTEPIPKHIVRALGIKPKSTVYTALVVADASERPKRKYYGFSFLKTRNGFTLFRIITEFS